MKAFAQNSQLYCDLLLVEVTEGIDSEILYLRMSSFALSTFDKVFVNAHQFNYEQAKDDSNQMISFIKEQNLYVRSEIRKHIPRCQFGDQYDCEIQTILIGRIYVTKVKEQLMQKIKEIEIKENNLGNSLISGGDQTGLDLRNLRELFQTRIDESFVHLRNLKKDKKDKKQKNDKKEKQQDEEAKDINYDHIKLDEIYKNQKLFSESKVKKLKAELEYYLKSYQEFNSKNKIPFQELSQENRIALQNFLIYDQSSKKYKINKALCDQTQKLPVGFYLSNNKTRSKNPEFIKYYKELKDYYSEKKIIQYKIVETLDKELDIFVQVKIGKIMTQQEIKAVLTQPQFIKNYEILLKERKELQELKRIKDEVQEQAESIFYMIDMDLIDAQTKIIYSKIIGINQDLENDQNPLIGNQWLQISKVDFLLLQGQIKIVTEQVVKQNEEKIKLVKILKGLNSSLNALLQKQSVEKNQDSSNISKMEKITQIGMKIRMLTDEFTIWNKELDLSKAKARCEKAHPNKTCIPSIEGLSNSDKKSDNFNKLSQLYKNQIYSSAYQVQCPKYSSPDRSLMSYRCNPTSPLPQNFCFIRKNFSSFELSPTCHETIYQILNLYQIVTVQESQINQKQMFELDDTQLVEMVIKLSNFEVEQNSLTADLTKKAQTDIMKAQKMLQGLELVKFEQDEYYLLKYLLKMGAEYKKERDALLDHGKNMDRVQHISIKKYVTDMVRNVEIQANFDYYLQIPIKFKLKKWKRCDQDISKFVMLPEYYDDLWHTPYMFKPSDGKK